MTAAQQPTRNAALPPGAGPLQLTAEQDTALQQAPSPVQPSKAPAAGSGYPKQEATYHMTVRKYEEDGTGRNAVPLRIGADAQVVARPANRTISLRLSQPEGKHD